MRILAVDVGTGIQDILLFDTELQVENFNPPCLYMGAKLAETMKTRSGKPLEDTAFSKASKLNRGLVGVVEVAGEIRPGDEVEVVVYEHPSWLARTDNS